MKLVLALVLVLWVVGEVKCAPPNLNPPFRSQKAPSEIIRNYTIHRPAVEIHQDAGFLGSHPVSLDLTISDFLIHLHLNRDLVAPHFTSHHYDESGSEIVEMGHVNCFYHGAVESFPEWHVVMSTCNGFRGSFGMLGDRNQYYHLELLTEDSYASLEQPHVLYLANQLSQKEATCGVGSSSQSTKMTSAGHSPTLLNDIHDPDLTHINRQRLRRQANGFNIVEWAVINDFTQYTTFERNLSATVLRDLEIANFVDGVYRTLNVRVVVVHVTTWTMGDRIAYPFDNDADTLLDNLRDYEPQITATHDSTMLITGVDLLGPTVGIAFIGTMCRGRLSAGLTQDGRGVLEAVGSTAAHELGHIFSMDHDTASCTCTDPSGVCIMAASSGVPAPVEWSSCSRDFIATGFARDNLDSCLDNTPSMTVGDPTCGNGIREGDEICDCGTPEECTDPCCNATVCRLRAGAQCPRGECCTADCQLKALGTECRAATQECDIAEFCMGSSSSCPTDTHKQDGSACDSGENFCFAGVCQIRDNQCMRYFDSLSGASECYSRLNVVGNGRGNCGASRGSFLQCDPEDVLCGQLQCEEGDFMRGDTSGSFTIFRTTLGSTTCRSFTTSANSDTISPGLVQDGTKCANGSVCVSQSCTRLDELDYIQSCPVGSNGLICSGEGVCNNLNQCSCSAGTTGATCEQIVMGGGGGGGGAGEGDGGGETDENGGVNGGVIAGAAIGTIIGLALIVAVVVGVVVLVIKGRSHVSKTFHQTKKATSSEKFYHKDASIGEPKPNISSQTTNHVSSSTGYTPPSFSPATPTSLAPPTSAPKPLPPQRAPPPAPTRVEIKPRQPPPSRAAPPAPPRSDKQPRKLALTPKPSSRPPPRSPKVAPSASSASSAPLHRRNQVPPLPSATKLPPVIAPKPKPAGKVQVEWPPPKDEAAAGKPLPPLTKKPIYPPRRQ